MTTQQAYDVRVVIPPATEPISLEEARLHLRLDAYGSPAVHDDDALIAKWIPAARRHCEKFSGRSFAPQTFEVAFHHFPHAYIRPGHWYAPASLSLPMPPMIGNLSVTYYDGASLVTLDESAYVVEALDSSTRLFPAFGGFWPVLPVFPSSPGSVRVRYQAGYSVAGESPDERPLPSEYRAAMLLVLTDLYENRSASAPDQRYELPLGVHALLGMDQARNGFA